MNMTGCLGCVIRLDHRAGLGTGFFYTNADNDLYLLTNKHIVVSDKRQDSPRILRAHIPRATGGGRSRASIRVMRIGLYDVVTGREKWRTCADPKVDVAVLMIDRRKLKDAFVAALSRADAMPAGNHIAIGSSVAVVGFPGIAGQQLYDRFSNLPIVRHASIATLPYLTVTLPDKIHRDTPRFSKIYKERFFLVDGVLGPGMSGSPVVSLPCSNYGQTPANSDFSCYLTGILSSGLQSLQLHAVWPADLIEEATQQRDRT